MPVQPYVPPAKKPPPPLPPTLQNRPEPLYKAPLPKQRVFTKTPPEDPTRHTFYADPKASMRMHLPGNVWMPSGRVHPPAKAKARAPQVFAMDNDSPIEDPDEIEHPASSSTIPGPPPIAVTEALLLEGEQLAADERAAKRARLLELAEEVIGPPATDHELVSDAADVLEEELRRLSRESWQPIVEWLREMPDFAAEAPLLSVMLRGLHLRVASSHFGDISEFTHSQPSDRDFMD